MNIKAAICTSVETNKLPFICQCQTINWNHRKLEFGVMHNCSLYILQKVDTSAVFGLAQHATIKTLFCETDFACIHQNKKYVCVFTIQSLRVHNIEFACSQYRVCVFTIQSLRVHNIEFVCSQYRVCVFTIQSLRVHNIQFFSICSTLAFHECFLKMRQNSFK